MERITRDQMLMEVAHVVAKRGTCSRLQVGAVFAQDGRIVATGYNGTPRGMAHCAHESYTWEHDYADGKQIPVWVLRILERNNDSITPRPGTLFETDGYSTTLRSQPGEGKLEERGCQLAEHAERNGIYYAAAQGIQLGGADLYVSHQPCYDCARALISIGIGKVYYTTPYRKVEGLNLLKTQGIRVAHIDIDSGMITW